MKQQKPIYRLGKRRSFLVTLDFMIFGFFLIMSVPHTVVYLDSWRWVLGVLGSIFFASVLCGIALFNYLEIYQDKIAINKFIFGDIIINAQDIRYCIFFNSKDFYGIFPYNVKILAKRRFFWAMFTVYSLTSEQAVEITRLVKSIKDSRI